eukprot:CAMPEP_0181138774 /NCGR_PEP_ID=MMETSP1071-20121207/34425_1 /TAXON_ID=35127 /ORGANISM="Thalassiosira sp., Strain NH16" /LENGTH=107 /DNA_ID=CAMNT_0023225631 /DNA_START=154 /DNA_END=477 /DNA_ORIENTATION=-
MASANWSRTAPCLRCLDMTRKKLANDESHGSISADSKRVWKHVLARSNASFFSSSFPLVYAHAFMIVEYVIKLGAASWKPSSLAATIRSKTSLHLLAFPASRLFAMA